MTVSVSSIGTNVSPRECECERDCEPDRERAREREIHSKTIGFVWQGYPQAQVGVRFSKAINSGELNIARFTYNPRLVCTQVQSEKVNQENLELLPCFLLPCFCVLKLGQTMKVGPNYESGLWLPKGTQTNTI